MNAPDAFKRLEGEPEIPSLTPRRGASNLRPIIAASVLLLSLVGALGFAATRYFGKTEAPVAPTADVASATATRIRFQDQPAVPPPPLTSAASVAPGPSVTAIAVPSIEADAAVQASRRDSGEMDDHMRAQMACACWSRSCVSLGLVSVSIGGMPFMRLHYWQTMPSMAWRALPRL